MTDVFEILRGSLLQLSAARKDLKNGGRICKDQELGTNAISRTFMCTIWRIPKYTLHCTDFDKKSQSCCKWTVNEQSSCTGYLDIITMQGLVLEKAYVQ